MKEAEIITRFLKDIRERGGYWYKLPDVGRTIKPFDFFYIFDGQVSFCEAKLIKNNTLHFSQIRDNQWTALTRIVEQGQKAVILTGDENGKVLLTDFRKILELSEAWETKITFS